MRVVQHAHSHHAARLDRRARGLHTRPSRGVRHGRLRSMDAGLRVQQGGSGEPVLLLLHGLGATGDVWDGWRPLLARLWPGRWLAPDLPGHGGSRPLSGYTFDALAAAIAGIVSGGARTLVLGHSLGGVVGLALASGRFSVPVQAVIGLGIKVAWTQEELDRGVQPGHPGAGDGTGRVAAHPRARDGPQPRPT